MKAIKHGKISWLQFRDSYHKLLYNNWYFRSEFNFHEKLTLPSFVFLPWRMLPSETWAGPANNLICDANFAAYIIMSLELEIETGDRSFHNIALKLTCWPLLPKGLYCWPLLPKLLKLPLELPVLYPTLQGWPNLQLAMLPLEVEP